MVTMTGCFTYVPADVTTVPPGHEVRVYMSRQALAALPEDIQADGLFLRGALTAQEADSLTLGVPVATGQSGVALTEIRQNVRVPMAEVVEVQRREFSGGRTALAVGGSAIGAAFIIALILKAAGAGDGGNDDGPDLARAPLFTIPLR
jgi:hypothetical protein